ncbi:MAG: hypothetical protein D6794_11315, partial [Deltaproteobacteria bacterium]
RVYGKSTTAKHYESDLMLFVHQIDKEPRAVTGADITEFSDSQLAAGLSRSTVNRRLATLSHFFAYLAEEEGDDSWQNPVVWKRHRLKTGHHLPRDLPEQSARQFWRSVEAGPVRDQAMIGLMLDVGLRAGEVIRLQTSDYERPQQAGGLAALRVWGKGNQQRRVWLTPETQGLIESYLQQRPQVTSDALFLTRRKAGFSLRGIQDRVKHYTHQAGLASEQVSCHRLRHTFARRMAESGMPLPSLSKWLGHRQLQTTQVYIDGANPTLRADYEVAMQELSRTAERTTESLAPSVSLSVQEAGVEPAQPGLEKDEIHIRLAALPGWLQDLVTGFLCSQQLRWKSQHRRSRAQQWLGELRRGWEWLLEEQEMGSMEQLRRNHLTAYLMHLEQQELSPHTINHFITTMQAFLRFAEETGQTVSPALFRIRRPKRPDDLPRPLRPADFAKLEQAALAHTQSTTPEAQVNRAWYLILCDTGVRISELTAFCVADWDSCNQTLLVRAPKFYHERRIPVSDRTRAAIDAHLTSRQESLTADQPLLVHRARRLTASFVRQRLHEWAASVQLQGVTPHRLRHSFATRMLNSGKMPITSLQKIMGHRHIDTTMRYVALYDTTVQQDYLAAIASLQACPLPDPDPAVWDDALQQAFGSDDLLADLSNLNCM